MLPGTGGLTRVIDKRRVRKDRADVFATRSEGMRGKQAVEWRLVDEVIPKRQWDETVAERAAEAAARSTRPADARAASSCPRCSARRPPTASPTGTSRRGFDRARGLVEITVHGPEGDVPGHRRAGARAGRASSGRWP